MAPTATPPSETPDERYIRCANECDLVAELCTLVDYCPYIGKVPNYWKPTYPQFARALMANPLFGQADGDKAARQVEDAFLHVCEVLGIAATSGAFLEARRVVEDAAQTKAEMTFVLANGIPMTREGKYRYQGIGEPVWHDTQGAAIRAAMAVLREEARRM